MGLRTVGVENRPLPLARPMAYTAYTRPTVQAVIVQSKPLMILSHQYSSVDIL